MRPLLSTFRIGRGADRHLAIDDNRVSQAHGFLRFVRSNVWILRDLASKNGTFHNGHRIEAGVDVELADQDELCFGSASSRWIFSAGSPSELIIASSLEPNWRAVPPRVSVVPLPSEQDPSAMLMKSHAGWLLEAPGIEARALTDGQVFSVGGVEYRAWLSGGDEPTTEGEAPLASLDHAQLRLSVSQDEEQVVGELRVERVVRPLPPRVHLYLLVLLARYRLQDDELGVSASEAGWRFADEIAHALGLDQQNLNVQVYRARSDIEKLGFQDSSSIIERRTMTRQMRIGFASDRLVVARL